MQESEYVLHIDFDKIKVETDKLRQVDMKLAEAVYLFVASIKKEIACIEPTLKKETNSERELWEDYRQLQREKLAVLDLNHEWDYLNQTVKDLNPKLDFLVKDAIEELRDHITVTAESHRAHIDILEIYNTRKIEVLALVITVIISYLAVWEFFVRDLFMNVVFPDNLSPSLNYLAVILSLMPVFITITWAWLRRKNYF